MNPAPVSDADKSRGAIPLFVFLAENLVRGGVTERMYRALSHWRLTLAPGLLDTNTPGSTVLPPFRSFRW